MSNREKEMGVLKIVQKMHWDLKKFLTMCEIEVKKFPRQS
jgi:hypothetical protein